MKIQFSNALLRNSRLLIALVASLLFGGSLLAQFQLVGTPAVVGLSSAKAQFIDYDSDGDMDLFTSGSNGVSGLEARIYNNNATNFTLAFTLPGSLGAFRWFDYDLDGDIDLLTSGYANGNPQTSLYRNDNSTAFTLVPSGLPDLNTSRLSVGDFDNDGDQDVFISGEIINPIVQLYYNQNGYFGVQPDIFLPLFSSYSLAGDIDNDGDLDLIYGGVDPNGNGQPQSFIYTNTNGHFTVSATSLVGYSNPGAALGDYDHDGDLDLALSGNIPQSALGAVYQNSGNGTFTQIPSLLDTLVQGTINWGDVDNDGDLDILQNGSATYGSTQLFLNNAGVFTNANVSFEGVYSGSAVFGDYDGDGKLDIFVIGDDSTSIAVARLYHNVTPTIPSNSSPQAPATMTITSPSDGDVQFSWGNGSDLNTPAAGLSYELFLSTAPGLHDISYPPSNPATGYHKVSAFGAIQGNSWTLHGASCERTYYARVQAIDGAYAGSTLSNGFSFTYPFDTQILNNDPVLTVVDAIHTDSIRWYDCIAQQILPNTGASFVATHIGSYAAIMYRFGCVDTTDCKNVTGIAIDPTRAIAASVFPNPANDRITVRLGANDAIDAVQLYDMQGRLLSVPTIGIVHNEATLDLSALPAGLYVLRTTLSGRDGFATAKFKKD